MLTKRHQFSRINPQGIHLATGMIAAYYVMLHHHISATYFVVFLTCASVQQAWSEQEDPLLASFQRVDEVIQVVQRHLYRPVSMTDLWNGALHSMLQNVDPEAQYISPEQRQLMRMNDQANGNQEGFGFDWRADHGNRRFIVSRIIAEGPAFQAGWVAGDRIVAAAGQSFDNLSLAEIEQLMLSLPTPCLFSIERADGTQWDGALSRATYQDHGVGLSGMIDAHYRIGYLAINRMLFNGAPENGFNMTNATALHVRQHINRLSDGGMRGLVIDLRGNAGGPIVAAVEIADLFLDGGTSTDPRMIVAQVSRHPEHQRIHLAHHPHTLPNWPIAVLIDSFTASSGEILAAALRDHDRAIIIGDNSYGKDSVQQMFVLNDGSGLLLTVAQFQTPSGQDLSRSGITPDIAIPENDHQRRKRLEASREHELINHPDHDPALRSARDTLRGVLLLGGG